KSWVASKLAHRGRPQLSGPNVGPAGSMSRRSCSPAQRREGDPMPTFRALPPSLRQVVRSKVADADAHSIHVPVARAMVDCGVYLDGQRLPGKYAHAGALAK